MYKKSAGLVQQIFFALLNTVSPKMFVKCLLKTKKS